MERGMHTGREEGRRTRRKLNKKIRRKVRRKAGRQEGGRAGRQRGRNRESGFRETGSGGSAGLTFKLKLTLNNYFLVDNRSLSRLPPACPLRS